VAVLYEQTQTELWVATILSRLSFTCSREATVFVKKKLPSKIITGNNQDSIAVYTDASVTQKVCSHILTSIAKNDKFLVQL
jgi:hypothetical protein